MGTNALNRVSKMARQNDLVSGNELIGNYLGIPGNQSPRFFEPSATSRQVIFSIA